MREDKRDAEGEEVGVAHAQVHPHFLVFVDLAAAALRDPPHIRLQKPRGGLYNRLPPVQKNANCPEDSLSSPSYRFGGGPGDRRLTFGTRHGKSR